jgi:hypothetical protein
MPKFELSGRERMARMMCKELLAHPALPRLELLRLMNLAVSENKRRRGRYQRLLDRGDIEPALELAASRKWLVEKAGGFRLTSDGMAIAKRSRTTRHIRHF